MARSVAAKTHFPGFVMSAAGVQNAVFELVIVGRGRYNNDRVAEFAFKFPANGTVILHQVDLRTDFKPRLFHCALPIRF